MTGRERLQAALFGGDCLAFAPRVWTELPSFVHLPVTTEFWRDVGSTERMLCDAARVCSADALTIPLFAQPLSPQNLTTLRSHFDVVELDAVVAVVAVFDRLRAIGELGVVAEVPGLDELAGLFPEVGSDDVEDILCDLVRICLETGAQAVLARASAGDEVSATLDVIGALAEFYQAGALGVDGLTARAYRDRCRLGLMGRDGVWPTLSTGVVLTDGDLTGWWTPDDVRAVVGAKSQTR